MYISKQKSKTTPYPKEVYYEECIRQFQGIPSIAITKNGRIFVSWESGGDHEPDPRQYLIVHYSDDFGQTWSEPVFAVCSIPQEHLWVGDIQLWVNPEGHLHIYWSQQAYKDFHPDGLKNLYMFPNLISDSRYTFLSICQNPDAEILEFSEGMYVFDGTLRNRPLVLDDKILYPTYNEYEDRFHYMVTEDGGKTFKKHLCGKKVHTDGDEGMLVRIDENTLMYFMRSKTGFVGQSVSKDKGLTWTDCENSSVITPPSRFCIDKLPDGNLVIINNDSNDTRENMVVQLSRDRGKTWIKKLIDKRWETSYPEFDYYKGKIYAVWDRERVRAKEILFTSFTEEDIINPEFTPTIKVLSKSRFRNPLWPLFYPNWYIPEDIKSEKE